MVAAVAAGGALGALARLAMSEAIGGPLATFTVNATGCLAIGLLMAYLTEVGPPGRYLRPFLGTGVLGGYTTFSAYAIETNTLFGDDEYAVAAAYVLGSVIAGLLAVQLGIVAARAALRKRGTA